MSKFEVLMPPTPSAAYQPGASVAGSLVVEADSAELDSLGLWLSFKLGGRIVAQYNARTIVGWQELAKA